MNFFQRFAIAFGRTAADIIPDVLPLAVDAGLRAILPPPPNMRVAALAGVRKLASATPDGAVIEGVVTNPKIGAKFAIKNGLPETDTDRRLIIENEPHMVDGFNGKIKEGYGKGTKTLLYHGPVVVKIGGKTSVQTADYHRHQADKAGLHFDLAVTGVPSQQYSLKPKPFEIHFCRGPFSGRRFAVVNTIMREGTGGRMLVPMRDKGVRLDKPDYRLKDVAWLRSEVAAHPGKYVIETKGDGGLSNILVQDGRGIFRSHREGGETYYDRLPALENLSNQSRLFSCRQIFRCPDLNGTVLKGELIHVGGPAKVAGVLNSNPDRAIAWQKENGPVKVYAWDIARYKGRDVSGKPYEYRRQLLESTIEEIRPYNSNWQVIPRMPAGGDPVKYFEQVTAGRGPLSEGVVVKDASNPGTWFKVKRFDELDLEIVSMVEGAGKYADSLGALVVRSPETGELGEIGSFSIPDADRDWLWANRDALSGGYATVRAMELTPGRQVPRAGVFTGMHQSKGSQTAIELLASKELN